MSKPTTKLNNDRNHRKNISLVFPLVICFLKALKHLGSLVSRPTSILDSLKLFDGVLELKISQKSIKKHVKICQTPKLDTRLLTPSLSPLSLISRLRPERASSSVLRFNPSINEATSLDDLGSDCFLICPFYGLCILAFSDLYYDSATFCFDFVFSFHLMLRLLFYAIGLFQFRLHSL